MAEVVFAEQRKLKIVEYIEQHRQASVAELVAHFQVSSATIRNDLRELSEARLVTRTHGGAMVRSQTAFELQSSQLGEQNVEAKREIGRLAAAMVEDGDTVLIDSGTTTLELARALSDRRNLVVVTNSLRIALELEKRESFQLIVIGGVVRKGFQCTVGLAGRNVLQGITVDKAFMGTNGLTQDKGASTPDLSHAEIKKAMIGAAKQVILLCDASKLGRDSFAQFARLEEIDVVVSETMEPELRKRLEESDVVVVTPPAAAPA